MFLNVIRNGGITANLMDDHKYSFIFPALLVSLGKLSLIKTKTTGRAVQSSVALQ